MTTPIQAQIEAARKVLRNSSCFCDEVCSLLPCKCVEAALTAAAEAGELATGVQDPATIGYAYHLEKLDREIAATIERCAQVVKDAADRHDSPLGCEPYTKAQLLEIYAAIRALKDKP